MVDYPDPTKPKVTVDHEPLYCRYVHYKHKHFAAKLDHVKAKLKREELRWDMLVCKHKAIRLRKNLPEVFKADRNF